MRAVLIIILIAAIAYIVYKSRKSLSGGGGCCSNGTKPESKVRPQDSDKANYPYTYDVKVDGMMCTNCARHVENTFNSAGFYTEKVDLDTNVVRLLSKKEETQEDLNHLFDGSSYDVTGVTQA